MVGRERAPGPWFDSLESSLTGVAIVGGTVGLSLEPVVEAGAVEPPPGTWWFLGLPTGPRTLTMSGTVNG